MTSFQLKAPTNLIQEYVDRRPLMKRFDERYLYDPNSIDYPDTPFGIGYNSSFHEHFIEFRKLDKYTPRILGSPQDWVLAAKTLSQQGLNTNEVFLRLPTATHENFKMRSSRLVYSLEEFKHRFFEDTPENRAYLHFKVSEEILKVVGQEILEAIALCQK